MKTYSSAKANVLRHFSGFLFIASVLSIASCKKIKQDIILKHFDQVNLVANNDEYHAPHIDSTLINAWGIAFNPAGAIWVNSQGGGVSEIYDKEGKTLATGVWIPGAEPKVQGNPTGLVFNSTNDFKLPNGKPAKFLIVGFDGILSGWNPDATTAAVLLKNLSATAELGGIAMGKDEGSNYIYAADFKSNKIITWDKDFKKISSFPFKDPTLSDKYHPWNIQAIGDYLYVAYAEFNPENGKNIAGEGKGVISVFKTNGVFVNRFAEGGLLNSPWAIAHAPASFFRDNEDVMFSNIGGSSKDMVLIGNFADGKINAYTEDGKWIGLLKSHGKPIVIDGLWALTFPPSGTVFDTNRLYFTAGPDSEHDGVFGYIIKD